MESLALVVTNFSLVALLGLLVVVLCRRNQNQQDVLRAFVSENQALRDQLSCLIDESRGWLEFRRDIEQTQMKRNLAATANQPPADTPLEVGAPDDIRNVSMPAHGAI